MSEILRIKDLSFGYNFREIFAHAEVSLEKGKIYGLLGPNGAGKTTLLNLLFGNLRPIDGKITWFIPPEERFLVRQYITIPNELTIGEFVEIIFRMNQGEFNRSAFLYSLPIVWQERMSELFDRRVPALSFGERKWVITVVALAFDRDLVALDEPTAAMDVPTRQSIWQNLKDAKAAGKTVIVSSHYLEEFENTADVILAIRSGRIEYFKGVEDFCNNIEGSNRSVNEAFMQYYS
ncbi:ATP-binding cassette domain-containing protein [Halomonas caseinilytica]|uniref:ABC-2 type transport system ATP-binding protein n=1 Tax=Halomonas caseinilytica TaxID=438744 RepID=A0A1M6V6L7_9GAMM|nr:ABC transporter ATP-binding protein [Halomonas caseinilytica]SHK77112.1 ABC-2 type transport system ATP-binding protein [Halomonas caseinilytica]